MGDGTETQQPEKPAPITEQAAKAGAAKAKRALAKPAPAAKTAPAAKLAPATPPPATNEPEPKTELEQESWSARVARDLEREWGMGI